jgi:cyclophilin family peptidyl-prolyl cis-trans isomerase
MKVCTKCKKSKPEDSYYRDSQRRDGLRPSCKVCTDAYKKENTDLEKQKRRSKEYYKKTKEKQREYGRIYYQKNRLKKDEQSKKWRKDNPEARKKIAERSRLKNKERIMWSAARDRAKSKGAHFNISIEDVVIPEVCPILGIRLVKTNSKTSPDSPTLDKVVPSLGYVVGNVQVISHKANVMKNSGTLDECMKLGEWARRMKDELQS